MKANKREIQRRIAYETARLLTEHRSDDHLFAMQKAAMRLGVRDKRLMPRRDEVAQALQEQQRLFRGMEQQNALSELRHVALQAMHTLKRFKPLLVGAVYEGTADSNSNIRLHLFSDTPEEVIFALSDLHIPWEERDCRLHFSEHRRKNMPCFHFNADKTHLVLIVLPISGPDCRPIDPRDDRPIQGVSISQLQQLLSLEAGDNG